MSHDTGQGAGLLGRFLLRSPAEAFGFLLIALPRNAPLREACLALLLMLAAVAALDVTTIAGARWQAWVAGAAALVALAVLVPLNRTGALAGYVLARAALRCRETKRQADAARASGSASR